MSLVELLVHISLTLKHRLAAVFIWEPNGALSKWTRAGEPPEKKICTSKSHKYSDARFAVFNGDEDSRRGLMFRDAL